MNSFAKIAFQSWFITVLVLLFIEWQIPGFVSFVMPVYWLIVLLVILGFLGSTQRSTSTPATPINKKIQYTIAVLVGLVLFGVILAEGSVFSFMRVPLAISFLMFPPLIVYLHKDNS